MRGEGRTIFSGEGTRRVFEVPAGRSEPLLLENIVIKDGSANRGAGLFVEASDQDDLLHLHRVTFEGNRAEVEGGGVFLEGRQANGDRSMRPVVISDSLFVDNRARSGGGGAIWNEIGHREFGAGGLYDPLDDDGAQLVVLQSAFDRNGTSEGSGGAIYNADTGTIVLQSNVFWGNDTERQGGAFFAADDSYSTLVNNHFVRNRATQEGGAVYLSQDALVTRTQHAAFGDLGLTAALPASLHGSHFWNNFFFGNLNNSGDQDRQVADPGASLAAGWENQKNLIVVRDGNESEFFTNANIGPADEGSITAAQAAAVRGADGRLGTAADGLFPDEESPLIDQGEDRVVFSIGFGPFGVNSERIYTNAGLPSPPEHFGLDVTTEWAAGPAGLAPRIRGEAVEIGAYELRVIPPPPAPVAKVIYVDDNAPGDENGVHDGNTWESAYLFLQDALLRAHLDDDVNEIWVAEAENEGKWYVHTVNGANLAAWKKEFEAKTAYNPGRPSLLQVTQGPLANYELDDADILNFLDVGPGGEVQLPEALDRRPTREDEDSPRTYSAEDYPFPSYFARDRYMEIRAQRSAGLVRDVERTYVRVEAPVAPATTGYFTPRLVLYWEENIGGGYPTAFGPTTGPGIEEGFTFPVMPTTDDRRIMIYGGFQGWRVSDVDANSNEGMDIPRVARVVATDAFGNVTEAEVVEQNEVMWRIYRPDIDGGKSWTVAEGARESYLVEQDTLVFETKLSGDLSGVSLRLMSTPNRRDNRFSRTVMTVLSDVNQLDESQFFGEPEDPRFVTSLLIGGPDYEGPDHGYDGEVRTVERADGEFDEYMVRVSDLRVIVDGLWIQHGFNPGSLGAGIRLADAYTVFNDIVVANNRARDGGGAYVNAGGNIIEPQFLNSTFVNNLAKTGDGGAMFLTALSDVTIFNTNFLENEAIRGGAVYFGSGINSSMVDRSIFANNRADVDGGAVYMASVDGLGDLVFTQTLFTGNYASRWGGAVYATQSDADVFNSVFSQNYASTGPALFNSNGIVSLIGVVVDENFVFGQSSMVDQIAGNTPYVAPTWFSVITGGFRTGVAAMNATIIDGDPMFDDINVISLIPGAPITSGLDAVIGFRELNEGKTKVAGMPRDRVFGGDEDELGFRPTEGSMAIEAGLGGRDAGIYETDGLEGGTPVVPQGAIHLKAAAIGGGWYYSAFLGDYIFVDGKWAYSTKYGWLFTHNSGENWVIVYQQLSMDWWVIFGGFNGRALNISADPDDWTVLPRRPEL